MENNKHNHQGCCGNHDHDHEGCCGGHGHDEEPITLDLSLEDGRDVKCEVVGVFEEEEQEYIALLPLEGQGEEEGKVLLYRFFEEGEEVNLENIEDDAEFEKVSKAFWEIFGEE